MRTPIFILLMALISMLGCSKESQETPDEPAFVAVRVVNTGTSEPAKGAGTIESLSFKTASCASGKTDEHTFSGTLTLDHTVNLVKGDTGCVLYLSKLVYKDGVHKDTYAPQSGDGIGGPAGTTGTLVGQTTGKTFKVEVALTLDSPLEKLEQATFVIHPGISADSNLYTSVTDFGNSDSVVPFLAPTLLIDLGIDASINKRNVLFVVECHVPLVMSVCDSQRIVDTRFKLLIAGAQDVSARQAVAAIMQDTTDLLRPTINHYYANGARLTAAISPVTPLQDLVLIADYDSGYRVYQIPASKVEVDE